MFLRIAVVATVLLPVATAHADFASGLTLKFNKLLIHENGNSTLAEPSNPNEATWHYFNKAHCTCALRQPDSDQASFAWEIIPENSTTSEDHPLEIYTGSACDNLTTQNQTCVHLTTKTISSVATIQTQNAATIEINLHDLMNPKPDDGSPAVTDCTEQQLDAATWLIADGNNDGTQDTFFSMPITTDTKPPPLPKGFIATGAENAIDISWDALVDATDVYGYQAFCATAEGQAAEVKTVPSPRYVTSLDLCGETDAMFHLDPSAIDTTDLGDETAAVTAPAAGLMTLDKAFLCGDQPSPTATSMRITGLENSALYQVAVIAVDKFGNPAGTYFDHLLRPRPATDFWEDIHARGGQAEGGFCLLNTPGGSDGPTTGLRTILALGILALITRRRRAPKKPRRVPAWAMSATMVAVTFGAIGAAHADDDAFDPNWNDPSASQDSQFAEYESVVKWHVGVRVGPYTPQIDSQIKDGITPGPYAQMFGGYSIMPMLDVERVIWREFGQISIGGNIGYLGKKEHAFLETSSPMDSPRERAKGDETKFKLIPFALTATYRFSYLDDQFGIPLVPYAKLGLAYYVWWMDAPNGDFSSVCEAGTSGKGCPTDSAIGASLGFQGTIGLAIRAERIDQAAANSMKESGLLHAGFYGELQLAKVDGFGSDKKLSVGDTTWFAGVDFEF